MANQEHLEILKQGVKQWNKWREENVAIRPVLSLAKLSGTKLMRASMQGADLSGADLRSADLRFAHLSGADLSKTNLGGADLSGADLSGVDLRGAQMPDAKFWSRLSRADLRGADLRGAYLGAPDLSYFDLRGANLSRAFTVGGGNLSFANLSGVCMSNATLVNVDLSGADLSGADLSGARLSNRLSGAKLRGVILSGVSLMGVELRGHDLSGADLSGAYLNEADLSGANLSGADLREARMFKANLNRANLSKAKLCGAVLEDANLKSANLTGADLTDADLSYATLVDTDFTNATIAGSRIYGISAWNVTLEDTAQRNLIISKQGEPVVTVDNLEVGQFIYLMLNNTKIRDVINTITSKGVLILGRFSDPQRKSVLDGLREKLREFDLMPMVFDFDRPTDRDYTETVQTLAGMSMFVIADLTDPKSIPLELEATVKQYKIPYIPIIDVSVDPHSFSMLSDLRGSYHWVLPTLGYEAKEDLLDDENLKTNIIDRVNAKREELRRNKNQEPEPLLICKKKVITSSSYEAGVREKPSVS